MHQIKSHMKSIEIIGNFLKIFFKFRSTYLFYFFKYLFRPKFYIRIIFLTFVFIFISSIPIIALTGIFLKWYCIAITQASQDFCRVCYPNIVVNLTRELGPVNRSDDFSKSWLINSC